MFLDSSAMERIFSDTCKFSFNLSADNLAELEVGSGSSANFEEAVLARKQIYLAEALPDRAENFRSALVRVIPSLRSA